MPKSTNFPKTFWANNTKLSRGENYEDHIHSHFQLQIFFGDIQNFMIFSSTLSNQLSSLELYVNYVQGDPNQNLKNLLDMTLKLCISDPNGEAKVLLRL